MTNLRVDEIRELLLPYVATPVSVEMAVKIQQYLAVFAVWSDRISLSTVKAPEEVVQRHFGEGLALADALPAFSSLLDLGSGAGFPGLPIALSRPGTQVVLAESQKRKASFLQEASGAMEVPVSVWAARAETLLSATSFDVVTLRAVDHMQAALSVAVELLRPGGTLAFFVGDREAMELPSADWYSSLRVNIAGSGGYAVIAQLAK